MSLGSVLVARAIAKNIHDTICSSVIRLLLITLFLVVTTYNLPSTTLVYDGIHMK
jgi:hypothetical protein